MLWLFRLTAVFKFAHFAAPEGTDLYYYYYFKVNKFRKAQWIVTRTRRSSCYWVHLNFKLVRHTQSQTPVSLLEGGWLVSLHRSLHSPRGELSCQVVGLFGSVGLVAGSRRKGLCFGSQFILELRVSHSSTPHQQPLATQLGPLSTHSFRPSSPHTLTPYPPFSPFTCLWTMERVISLSFSRLTIKAFKAPLYLETPPFPQPPHYHQLGQRIEVLSLTSLFFFHFLFFSSSSVPLLPFYFACLSYFFEEISWMRNLWYVAFKRMGSLFRKMSLIMKYYKKRKKPREKIMIIFIFLQDQPHVRWSIWCWRRENTWLAGSPA